MQWGKGDGYRLSHQMHRSREILNTSAPANYRHRYRGVIHSQADFGREPDLFQGAYHI